MSRYEPSSGPWEHEPQRSTYNRCAHLIQLIFSTIIVAIMAIICACILITLVHTALPKITHTVLSAEQRVQEGW